MSLNAVSPQLQVLPDWATTATTTTTTEPRPDAPGRGESVGRGADVYSLDGAASVDGGSMFVVTLPGTVDSLWLQQLIDSGLAAAPVGPVGPVPSVAPVAPSRPASEQRPAEVDEVGILRAGRLVVDLHRVRVSVANRQLILTHQEFMLLQAFLENPDRVFSRRQLLNLAWDSVDVGVRGIGRTVDVHVRRLRAKLGPEARRIVTVRGFGYSFDASEDGSEDAAE